MLHSILMVIHFFAACGIIGLVLLQRGKGAEAGAGFGAGASGTVFGARGAGTALSRATAILAAVFMITSLSLTYVSAHNKAAPTSVLERAGAIPAPTPANLAPSSPAPASPAPTTTVPAAPAK
ncbi:MAG: preprotein translocase subunit SecG [Steroidobacteraceae bacterium]|jgi:preprotein translocase subunit SecG